MTTRFSIADLASMLREPVDIVRVAVDTLAESGQLTAESFVYADKNWRVAPSDVKRIQAWLQESKALGQVDNSPSRRIIKRKKVIAPSES